MPPCTWATLPWVPVPLCAFAPALTQTRQPQEAPNYDKDKKLIRSLFTGSRGPMLRKATGLDWAGDRLVLPEEGGWGA